MQFVYCLFFILKLSSLMHMTLCYFDDVIDKLWQC